MPGRQRDPILAAQTALTEAQNAHQRAATMLERCTTAAQQAETARLNAEEGVRNAQALLEHAQSHPLLAQVVAEPRTEAVAEEYAEPDGHVGSLPVAAADDTFVSVPDGVTVTAPGRTRGAGTTSDTIV